MKNSIWIYEDDLAIRDSLELILAAAGYHTRSFSDPGILDPANGYPDLYLLDRQVTGIDGLDICRQLKSGTSTRNIPIVMISASPQVARLAAVAGADYFLEKPFDMQELLKGIKRCIEAGSPSQND